MKARVAALATAVLTAAGMLAVFTPGPANAQGVAFPGASFSGYSTGTAVHADVLQVPGAPRLVDGEVAFSGGATNTAGLSGGVNNEMDEPVATSQAGKNSYGRGTGAEVGLGTNVPSSAADANQIILAGLAEAAAPPTTPLVTKEILGTQIPGNPLIFASLLRGQAQARWNPNSCILGAPTDFGLGYAADAQLLSTSGKNLDPTSATNDPLVSTDTNPNGEDVSQTKSFTYLRPEPDGSFAVVSEVREQLAPVTLFKTMANAQLTINVAGEWFLRTISTGKAGGSYVEYGTTGNSTPNVNTLVSIVPPGGPAQDILHVQDLFGPGKIPTQIALGSGGQFAAIINVGEKPRAIGSDDAQADAQGNLPAPQKSADGTTTGAAVDVVRVQLIVPATGQHIGEVRVGHMEAKSVAPAGGIDCPIPVTKTANPDPVTAGNPFTWTITIPSAPDSLAGTDCDLTNIKAVDNATVLSGKPSANVTGADNGGVIGSNKTVSSGKTVTINWDNLGSYHPGDPPKVITISGNIPANSGAGVIQNTVTVTASLGNCKGGASGTDLIGNATIEGTANVVGAAVKGTATVQGPKVNAAAVKPERLAETGQKDPWLPVAGGGLLLGALALMRSRRRLQAVNPEA